MKNFVSCSGLLGTILLLAGSCGQNVKSSSGEFGVEFHSKSFFNSELEAFMYNGHVHSIDRDRTKLADNTLYIVRHNTSESKTQIDTMELHLTTHQVDSLYMLTYDFLSEFKIKNELEEGTKTIETATDGADFTASLIYADRYLKAALIGSHGTIHHSAEVDKLLVFLNRNLPNDFRLYY